jgi:hypothetical protein
VVGAAAASRQGVAESRAALALDAAARTDEAFVSAIAATDAVPEMRALAADYAVARCPRSAVGRFLPVRAPGAASAAAVATALVAALVLVPRAAATERAPTTSEHPGEVELPAASPSAETSPRGRVDRLRDAVARSGEREASSLAPAVRKDLGAVSTADLRKLAEALATSASSAEAAKRAIAALDRGDRAAATAALREALGGLPSATTPEGLGSAKASAAPPAAQTPGSWAGATWPLRYDRVVRRWIAETETR